MADAPQSVDLETFLTALPEVEAAEARVAAARIDALERMVGPPGWIERNMIVLCVVALAMFLVGAAGLFGIYAWGAILGLGGVTILVAAFPALMFAYLLSVRGRTGADHEKMALNQKHFLPHQGLYFGDGNGGGKVVRVDWQPTEMNLREITEARHGDVMKGRF